MNTVTSTPRPGETGAPEERSVGGRFARAVAARANEFATRSGVDWLVYNPYTMYQFHVLAARDAPAVMRAIERCFPEAKSYVDVGAGSGAFAAEARRRGRQVMACEYSVWGRLMARMQGVPTQPFKLEEQPPANVGRFDLAYCFEVAEHVPASLADRLVAFLARLAPATVFTAAPPGQGGTQHVNEQPMSYWIEKFDREGQRHDSRRTARIKQAFVEEGVSAPWLLENVNVFA